jgi:hypothetical protein
MIEELTYLTLKFRRHRSTQHPLEGWIQIGYARIRIRMSLWHYLDPWAKLVLAS